MNRQNWTVAVVGAVSGALGAGMVAAFAGKAFAVQPEGLGQPQIVQLMASPAPTVLNETTGLLFRLWSDGTVDMVGYAIPDPCGLNFPVCLELHGFVPPDLGSRADVNNDGLVDGADMGILLGEWDGAAAGR